MNTGQSLDPLLQPYRLKHLTLRNRIMTTSHEPAYPEDGMPKARYRAYHVERAKGGVALTMTAGSAVVSRDSPPAFNNVLAYKDEVVRWMAELTDACHEHGAAVMIQLTHLGRRSSWSNGDWLPIVSPSGVREPAHRAFPKVIEDWDLARIARDYADAAERMQAAGLDGIELEAYGHLLDAFWSPGLNELTAPFGGSLDNCMRFPMQVLRAIRERVGSAFIVGVRFAADENRAGGLSKAEGIAIGRKLRDSGLVDFLNIIRGSIETDAALTGVIPVMGMKSAPHLDFAGEMRAATGFPTFHAAKISDVATARHAVANGLLDMVGMTRAHLADPHIVRKIIEGREGEIRPCVGATYCLDRIYQGADALCVHNPATGRELAMPQVIARASRRRRVVVIGAGPAGLEAARVAGERGHEVTVFEAAAVPGGQVRLCALSPRKKDMLGIVEWRMHECARLGVAFRFGVWAEIGDVLGLAPDVVIVATGGLADSAVFGEANELVVSAWDILAGDVKPGHDVLIWDDAGDHVGLQAAEVIAAAGGRVEIITRDRTFAPEVMGMNLVPYIRALQPLGAVFTVALRVDAVAREGNRLRAVLGSDYGAVSDTRLVDQLVVNHGTKPLADLYFALKASSQNLGELDYSRLLAGVAQDWGSGGFELYRIGDAVSGRNIHAAIYDALRLLKDV